MVLYLHCKDIYIYMCVWFFVYVSVCTIAFHLNKSMEQFLSSASENVKVYQIAEYNRNTAWLRDTVRQTSRGNSADHRSALAADSRGTSAWPYRVTTQYSFYPVQIYS